MISRFVAPVLLLILVTGCVTSFNTGTSTTRLNQAFQEGVNALQQNGDVSGLQAIADTASDPELAANARYILQLHEQAAASDKVSADLKKQRKTIGTLQRENSKLREDIDKLTRINLEMEQREP